MEPGPCAIDAQSDAEDCVQGLDDSCVYWIDYGRRCKRNTIEGEPYMCFQHQRIVEGIGKVTTFDEKVFGNDVEKLKYSQVYYKYPESITLKEEELKLANEYAYKHYVIHRFARMFCLPDLDPNREFVFYGDKIAYLEIEPTDTFSSTDDVYICASKYFDGKNIAVLKNTSENSFYVPWRNIISLIFATKDLIARYNTYVFRLFQKEIQRDFNIDTQYQEMYGAYVKKFPHRLFSPYMNYGEYQGEKWPDAWVPYMMKDESTGAHHIALIVPCMEDPKLWQEIHTTYKQMHIRQRRRIWDEVRGIKKILPEWKDKPLLQLKKCVSSALCRQKEGSHLPMNEWIILHGEVSKRFPPERLNYLQKQLGSLSPYLNLSEKVLAGLPSDRRKWILQIQQASDRGTPCLDKSCSAPGVHKVSAPPSDGGGGGGGGGGPPPLPKKEPPKKELPKKEPPKSRRRKSPPKKKKSPQRKRSPGKKK